MERRPNILFFHVDNLGAGELSCYSGGPFRGAWTENIDNFAKQGLRMTNYAPEAQCTPSRSAVLTGRYSIRSGTHSVPIGGSGSGGWGLVAWEKTLGDLLGAAGYACSMFGKWHVGEGPGRWPIDHGFETWVGIPRTYEEALWSIDPWYRPGRDPVSKTVRMQKGDVDVREGEQLTMEVRRDIDERYLDAATAYMTRAVEEERPFFVYFNHSLMHMPTIPRAEYKGKSGNGEWADCLLELDGDFARLLDCIRELEVDGNTLVVFAGDNGPEEVQPWRGTPGYWEGSYFAGGEGNLRTPCIVRMPGAVAAERVSNEIMHITDWFSTILAVAGVPVPDDRVIDGVDQWNWICGGQEVSNREGYPYWMGKTLYGVKWHDFKVAFMEQKYSTDAAGRLASPHVINLVADPQEREPLNPQYLHSWVAHHVSKILADFQKSVEAEPLIPENAPLDYVPKAGGK